MTNEKKGAPTMRALDLALEGARGPDAKIDAELCRFFFWGGLEHGQASLLKPFEVDEESGIVRFQRTDATSPAAVPLPPITGSVEEAAALVRAFAPHVEWLLRGASEHVGQTDARPWAALAPNVDDLDLGAGAVSKYGATSAIALLRALLQVLGRDGFTLHSDYDNSAVGRAGYQLNVIAHNAVKDGLGVLGQLSDGDFDRLRKQVLENAIDEGIGTPETGLQAGVVEIEALRRERALQPVEVPF